MTVAIARTQNGQHKNLVAWAAFQNHIHSGRSAAGTASQQPPPRQQVPVVARAAVLEIDTAVLHSSGCLCTMCSPASLGASGIGNGGGRIFDINLTGQLSDEEREAVQHLQRRDAEVRRHEQAHLNAAGRFAMGGPKYTYQVGPDGQRYAVGGEVQVDLSPEHTPEATLRKAQILQQAALAPVDPSGADRSVAALARRMAENARRQMTEERLDETFAAQKPPPLQQAPTAGAAEPESGPIALAGEESILFEQAPTIGLDLYV